MFYTALVLVAAAIAGRFQNPIIAFALGIATNFIVDLIPHTESIERKYIPWVNHFKNKDHLKGFIFLFVDMFLTLALVVILTLYASEFTQSDIFKTTSSISVLAAIMGVLLLPVLEIPYKVLGLNLEWSKRIFNLKKKLNLYDSGISGYIVQISLIVISVILIIQVVQTPFGKI